LLAPLHAVSRPGSPPQAAPRENLIEAIWGFNSEVHNNTLDAFVRLLRDKVDAAGESKLVQSLPGVGYCLREKRV
jgi:two-component system response regulator MprA